MMHCDGKCCLKKKLAKEAKDQAPSPRNQKNEQVVTLFYSNSRFDLKISSPIILQTAYPSYNDLGTASFHYSVFHPPTA